MSEDIQHSYINLTCDVVSAYVSNNPVPAAELAHLIQTTYTSITGIAGGQKQQEAAKEPQQPAVNPKKSVHDDFIVCLEDGQKFKSLKRHLRTKYNLSPEDYRAKWGLAKDYPMVAPAYARARSDLARSMQLGHRGASARAANATRTEKAAPSRGRGRRKVAEAA